MNIRYKFLEGKKSANGDHIWRKNKWYKIDGELEICVNGFHSSKLIPDALNYVAGDTLAVVEVCGKSIKEDDKECWEEMRVLRFIPFTKVHAVRMALFSAKLCIHIYESQYPDDNRPRHAIEATEAWLDNPCPETESAAMSAASILSFVPLPK